MWDEVGCFDDGSCHELGEEGYVEGEVEEVSDGFDESSVYVDGVAYYLEGVEGYSDGQDYVVCVEDGFSGCGVCYLSEYVFDVYGCAE